VRRSSPKRWWPRAGAEGTRIDLDDVCRFFPVGDAVVKALDQVNLHVDDTAFVVVLGASGSGKTTLLNLIGALDAPTSGTVLRPADARHWERPDAN
jgi:putative ABC transport system ATP-binding protein